MDPTVALIVSEVSLGQAISTSTSTRYSRDDPVPDLMRTNPAGRSEILIGVDPMDAVALKEGTNPRTCSSYYLRVLYRRTYSVSTRCRTHTETLLHTVSDRNIY